MNQTLVAEPKDPIADMFMSMLHLQSECNDIALRSPTAGGWIKIVLDDPKINYGDALWVECGELLSSYGYKWWKHTVPDVDNVKMELIDIFHFGMSLSLVNRRGQLPTLATRYADEYRSAVDYVSSKDVAGNDSRFRARLRELVSDAGDGIFVPTNFFVLCQYIGLSLNDLYQTYLGKNVLNVFRNRNGYTDGTYKKHWYVVDHGNLVQDIEDNAVLKVVIENLVERKELTFDNVYSVLERIYATVRTATLAETFETVGSLRVRINDLLRSAMSDAYAT